MWPRETRVTPAICEALLHAKILRSPHAHARILDIDTTEAEKLPGVVIVLPSSIVSCQCFPRNARHSYRQACSHRLALAYCAEAKCNVSDATINPTHLFISYASEDEVL